MFEIVKDDETGMIISGYAIIPDKIEDGVMYTRECLENASKNFKPCPILDENRKVIGQVTEFNNNGSFKGRLM